MFGSDRPARWLRAPLPLSACLLLALLVSCGFVDAAPDPAAETDLAAELPRLKPVEPEDVQKTFTVQHGFSLQLVAHEPLLADPVDACFDPQGRLYVAEMHGYPYSEEARAQQPEPIGKHDAGIIRLLEDTDGDGVFDHSTVFADQMSWPTSVCCYDGGVFALAPTEMYYLKDTDGDGKADVRRTVFTGFSRANVQAVANNMKWGLDNRIYVAGGTNRDTVLKLDGKEIGNLSGKDFCFDPRTMEVEFLTGGRQFGHSFDDWGNRYVCSNSNHIQHIVFPRRYLDRTPGVGVSGTIRSIAKDGPSAPVFRASPAEPWRIVRTRRRAADPRYRDRLPPTELVPTGFFTSATGVTIYRGAAYPPEFQGNAFIGDVGGNLIHRKTLHPKGVTFEAVRADANVEFVTSTDTWFRPVNFVNGPDGYLYVLDMYRETIEHPASIPEDIKSHLDLESGDARGRIYRLLPPGTKTASIPDVSDSTTSELVALLESPHAALRETAHRLLWERQDKAAVPALRKLLTSANRPTARLHALYSLVGLESVESSDLLAGLRDDSPRVREHAVLLAEPHLADSPELIDAILALSDDDDTRVQMQVAFTIGEMPAENLIRGIITFTQQDNINSDVRQAMATSIRGHANAIALELISDAGALENAGQRRFLGQLLEQIGGGSSADVVYGMLAEAATSATSDKALPLAVQHLGAGLRRKGQVLKLTDNDRFDDSQQQQLATFVEKVTESAESGGSQAAGAVALLANIEFNALADVAEELLTPQTPVPLQVAVVRALGNHPSNASADTLLEVWSVFTPQVRQEAIEALTRSNQRIETLLEALKSGTIKISEIAPDKRQTLVNHPRKAIADAATQLFDAGTSPDRNALIGKYEPALEGDADAERGHAVFKKNCATCHRVGQEGFAVGPDLVSISNKSPRDLLISILDPNREAQPNFTSYTALTESGQVHTGLIAAETATSITLRRAEGKEDILLRENIEVLKSNGISLMPVGLEKEIPPAQMADVVAFIKSLQKMKTSSN
ncbi:Cytochrome c [Maioricimonas rarisocia]|uniref:Cytochrome c n=1 Tax=Maioricimonas rarisocia TaxID=2528026 RepID=A0A517Z8Y2_9PLAN|nr:PVC-type heme-binding CxxCH protein [Maioricimonas rarisocia]QDU38942.1 Cytochrome c [Maioricimonas rarisocia]